MALANLGIQGLSPYQAGKPIEELQRELGIRDIVKLASNENPLGPSAAVIAACEKAARDSTRYPDANGFELKRALADKFSLQTEQLTLGCGSNDVLDLIARVLSGAEYLIRFFAIWLCRVSNRDSGRRCARDCDASKKLGQRSRGDAGGDRSRHAGGIYRQSQQSDRYLAKQNRAAWLFCAVPQQVVVVLDEAYTEYVDAPDFPNGLTLLNEFPNLIVTRTFSKAYGLAGLRVGYAASSPQIADLLNRVRAPFNVNSLGLAAAVAALADDDYLARSRELNLQGMAQIVEGVTALDLEVIPSVGNFVTVAMPGEAMPIYQRLLREGVIVRPLVPYGMPNHLRVSIGLPEENAKFLVALLKVL